MFLERSAETLLLGLNSLARNKLRSFLTMLGMIFGVASVIAMLSVGAGARHDILSSIEELGIQNIIVNSLRPADETRASEVEDGDNYVDRYGLTFHDQDLIRETVSSVSDVLPVNLVKRHVWYGSSRVQSSVLGVLPEHLEMFGFEAAQGRLFNHVDAATEAKVCIVRRARG
jgi:putative ABC transport system permease protein